MNHPLAYIIVLNYKNADNTIRCIRSLGRLTYPNYKIVLVDNFSNDGSLNKFKELSGNFSLIENRENSGYAGGNNLGIKYALDNHAEYVLILNNDTEVIAEKFLDEIITELTNEPDVGICGPMIVQANNKIQHTCMDYITLRGYLQSKLCSMRSRDYHKPHYVNCLSGVCMLIKKNVFKDTSLLDEDYFMYCEEQDFQYKAKKAGWKIKYIPVKSIIHFKDFDNDNPQRLYRRIFYYHRNVVLFNLKNNGFGVGLIFAIFFCVKVLVLTVLSFFKLTNNKNIYNTGFLKQLIVSYKNIFVLKKDNFKI